jgi:1-aminocyclopropane-1-carboxylate deaminase/D-cysteine desulfhydrase-like pyridoxal-dependent ACC family enzyme
MNGGKYSGNLLIDKLMGAKTVYSRLEDREEKVKNIFQEEKSKGNHPYLIPYGGSNKIGAYAYLLAMHEMIEQTQESLDEHSRPDWIVFATSSGGTQAGMLAGACNNGFTGKILGISVDVQSEPLRERIAELANQVIELSGGSDKVKQSEILVNDDYLGDGYGVAGDAEKSAIELFARLEGILLDPVYTGRAAAGLLDLHKSGFFRKDNKRQTNILFWHTGGTPALLSRNYEAMW